MSINTGGAENKFLIKKVNDLTYLFFDRSSVGTVYVLMATPFGESLSHICLAQTEDSGSYGYMSMLKELWSNTFFEANLINLVDHIQYQIESGYLDITNPVPLVLEFGGTLHGYEVTLPKPHKSQYN